MDKPLKDKLGEVEPSYGTWEVLEQTYDIASMLIKDGIEGAFVECGVGAGSSPAVMLLACERAGVSRPIWGFDSFQGIPWAGENDDDQPGIGEKDPSKQGLLETSGVSAHSLEQVKGAFKHWQLDPDKVNWVEGWFQDTLPKVETGKIALLRLDGDLYDSTLVCLHYLYPKLVKGGILIIDDYQLPGCRQAFYDYFFPLEVPPLLHNLVGYCPSFIKL